MLPTAERQKKPQYKKNEISKNSKNEFNPHVAGRRTVAGG